jgi:protein-L-isoaspartate(D-aspartate) O-methyltransferase
MLSRFWHAAMRRPPGPVRAGMLMMLSLWSREAVPAADDAYTAARERMVSRQIEARGISDTRVLGAMRSVPRHLFVPSALRDAAYDDEPLPIGLGQTISQPYIVALMTELARPQPKDRALEVGTGSGYQAAVLATLVAHVYTIELEQTLSRTAAQVLRQLDYDNVTVRTGDGYAGWPEVAPFDIILVTAAPDHVPQPLLDQLRPGGRLVVPVGEMYATQQLQIIEKDSSGKLTTTNVSAVRFVPLRRQR